VALQGFSHIGICVTDIDRSKRFYTDVLGFSTLYDMDFVGNEVAVMMEQEGAFRSTMLRRDDVRVELLQWVDVAMTGTGERKPMTQLGFTHLSFRVDEIDGIAEAAVAAGGTVQEQTLAVMGDPDGEVAPTRLVFLTDPDGTRIELMENVPDLSLLAPPA
jgi:glyoxylase I family protein